MSISTDDCKELLSKDSILLARGAGDKKGWRRLSKKNGSGGVERVFAHGCGALAKVVESSGQIYIASSGDSLASLADPSHGRVELPGGGGEAPPAPTDEEEPLWTRLAKTRVLAAAAERVAARNTEWDDDEKVLSLDPIAWANQFVFAVGMGAMHISPKKHFDEEGCCYDQESPIDHLLPPGSEDVNGCGTWEIPFAGAAVDLAVDLMSRGFHWDRGFQEFIDGCSDFDGMAEMSPVLERRELGNSTPKAKGSQPRKGL